MQENRFIKILVLLVGVIIFALQRDAVSAAIYFASMIFYAAIGYSEVKKSSDLEQFKEELKKVKDRVDSMAIQRAFK